MTGPDVGPLALRLRRLSALVLTPTGTGSTQAADREGAGAAGDWRRYTTTEIAAYVVARNVELGDEAAVSAQVDGLLAGSRSDASPELLAALAGFFGVSAAYFAPNRPVDEVEADLLGRVLGDLDAGTVLLCRTASPSAANAVALAVVEVLRGWPAGRR